MTLAQVERRLVLVEPTVLDLREQIEYEQAVEGIRRGLASADRAEGEPVASAFASLRRKCNNSAG